MLKKLGLFGALVAALILATAIAAVAGAAQSASQPTIKPHTGHPKTKFVLRFRAPESTMQVRRYTIHASTSSHSSKCNSSVSAVVRQANAGETVRVKLIPASGDRKWCLGKFHGKIELVQGPVCDPIPYVECPDYEVAAKQVGKFSFRVRRRSSTHS